jgi:hypothetical protein
VLLGLRGKTAAYHIEWELLSVTASLGANVRFGSKAEMGLLLIDVRFTPESGHRRTLSPCPLCAQPDMMLLKGFLLPIAFLFVFLH